MSQLDQETISASRRIAKCYGDRLARVFVTMPYSLSITEGTVNSGIFDTFNTAGLAAPDNAPGAATGAAGVLTGAYAYYVTFYDNNRGVEGDESAQSSTVNPSGQRVTVDLTTITNESSNSRFTHFRIYRNLNGGSTYFFVAQVTVATASYDDNNSDASISANDTLQLDNTPPAVDTYGLVLTHKAYMFMAGPYNGIGNTDYDDDFTWSKLNNPDAWPTVNRSKVERGRCGQIRALASRGDVLTIYKDRAIYELHFDTDPSGTTGDGYGKTVNTERGALNHRCVVNWQGRHLVMDQQGIYEFNGGTRVDEIGKAFLDRYWRRINWSQREKFSAAYDDDHAVWFVALDTDTECKYAFVLNLKVLMSRGQYHWHLHKFDAGIRDCVRWRVGPDATAIQFGMQNTPVIAVLTEYGYTGFLRAGYRDFVPPRCTASGTVTSSGTTTITDSAATFTRTNADSTTESVVGAYLRFLTWPSADKPGSEDWSQPYRITTVNSATQVTLTPAMPSAPPAGAAYVIGAIPDALMTTPILTFGAPLAGKKAKQAVYEFQPGGMNFTIRQLAKLDRRGYETVARTASDTEYAATSGNTYATINMGGSISGSAAGGLGVAAHPLPGRGFRKLQVVLDASGVDQPAIVDSITIDVMEMESDA